MTYNYLTESHLQSTNGHIRKNVARRLEGVVSNKESKTVHTPTSGQLFLFLFICLYYFIY